MPTSTGQRRKMRHVGTLAFSVRGEALTLGAFVEEGSTDLNRLFVPFMDLTSGGETYPAGRYLDLELTRTGIYLIDFNRAYNPVLLLQSRVRLSLSPSGQPPAAPDSRRRKSEVTLEGVVFDFDGVIANSEPLHLRVYQILLSQEGLAFSASEYYERYLGIDDIGVFQALARDKGLDIGGDRVAELLARKSEIFLRLAREGPVLFDGAAECVRRLSAAVPVAIASGALRHEIEADPRRRRAAHTRAGHRRRRRDARRQAGARPVRDGRRTHGAAQRPAARSVARRGHRGLAHRPPLGARRRVAHGGRRRPATRPAPSLKPSASCPTSRTSRSTCSRRWRTVPGPTPRRCPGESAAGRRVRARGDQYRRQPAPLRAADGPGRLSGAGPGPVSAAAPQMGATAARPPRNRPRRLAAAAHAAADRHRVRLRPAGLYR